MQNKLDNIIQELKELSGNSRLNIELPDDIFISAYERKIGFIFPKDYKKVLKEISKHPANTALPSDPISLNLVPT
ncbi:SMI1/KNR4 family protein [Acinetobacter variabilis]|uniref:SMI1/KNR4 family protein n=1 Tax=Acinetobacter variabilis TaxID=70346 RepID=UPI000F68344F|nr:SMI1/KNR4 family protein [Acinetobacter variabilis]